MNIAYISADFGVPILGNRGGSVHVREMVTAFRKAGHSVWVISPAVDKGQGETNDVLFPVLQAEGHLQLFEALKGFEKFLGLQTRLRQELRNVLYNLTLYEKALPHLRRCCVDFIYERYALFSYAGIRLARELGVPHILEVNAPLAYEQEKTRGLEMKELAREAERRIFCATDKVVVVSQRLGEFVASCGVPEARIYLLPNAVDPQRFAAMDNGTTVRAQYRLEGKRVIGFVGSLRPWHGTETLVEAFRALYATTSNTHLLIVGDGPGRETLKKYAQANELSDAVTFTGDVPYDDIPHHIAAMDVTVAPGVPNENFYFSPIKIFEYMAMGKPVVAGSIGQVAEVIAHGETGVLFEPGNVGQLTAALVKLTSDAQLCERLGTQAKAWVQKERTWENNARQVVAIADRLLVQRGGFAKTTKRQRRVLP